MKDPNVLTYLREFQKKFVIVTASINFTFICKKFYVSRILKEITGSNTYSKSLRASNDIRDKVSNFSKTFGIEVENESKQLPSMYWIPKMLKKPIGAKFIIASKKCTTNVSPKLFKVIFKHVECFHKYILAQYK